MVADRIQAGKIILLPDAHAVQKAKGTKRGANLFLGTVFP
jgi:hypothetical protein